MDRRKTLGNERGDTTCTVVPVVNRAMERRREHQAAFDTAIKEIFLGLRIQLREPLSGPNKDAAVFNAYFQGTEVAVKILSSPGDDLQDAVSAYGVFKVECEKTMILSRRSRSIVQVIDYGDADLPADFPTELREFFQLGLVPFMITEKAPYGSLDKAFKRRKHLPGFDRVSLMEAVVTATEGIREAHEHQVAHRDIKPQNLLIFGPAEGKIADFGVARWRHRLNRKDTVLLTPRYCSPEQAFHALTGERENLVGIAGDIYSWAIMVYELVTGDHPFDWAVQSDQDPMDNQQAVLRAIAANDRRGFVPTGDITFDSLMDSCTSDIRSRITDITVPNRVLHQLVSRLKLG